MEYKYKAITPNGEKCKGNIEADSYQSARLYVLKNIGTPLQIKQVTRFAVKNTKKTKLPQKDILLLVRNLATLTGGGLTIGASLSVVADVGLSKKAVNIIQSVSSQVESGEMLSTALENTNSFPAMLIKVCRVGEMSDNLPQALCTYADFIESQAKAKEKLWEAVSYPIFMSIASLCVLVFLLCSVLPRMTSLLNNLKTDVPLSTKLVMGLSNVLVNYGFSLLFLFAIAVICLLFINKQQPTKLAEISLKIPLVGSYILLRSQAQTFKSIESMLRAGVEVVPALKTLTGSNSPSDMQIKKVANLIEEGASVKDAFASTGFPEVVSKTLNTGEKTGNLADSFKLLANYFENSASTRFKLLSSVLEPLIILSVGVIVGFVVLSVAIPIFNASQTF